MKVRKIWIKLICILKANLINVILAPKPVVEGEEGTVPATTWLVFYNLVFISYQIAQLNVNWKYLHKIKRKRKLLHTFYFLQSTDFSVKNNKKSWSDFCLLINYEWVGLLWCCGITQNTAQSTSGIFQGDLGYWGCFHFYPLFPL